MDNKSSYRCAAPALPALLDCQVGLFWRPAWLTLLLRLRCRIGPRCGTAGNHGTGRSVCTRKYFIRTLPSMLLTSFFCAHLFDRTGKPSGERHQPAAGSLHPASLTSRNFPRKTVRPLAAPSTNSSEQWTGTTRPFSSSRKKKVPHAHVQVGTQCAVVSMHLFNGRYAKFLCGKSQDPRASHLW